MALECVGAIRLQYTGHGVVAGIHTTVVEGSEKSFKDHDLSRGVLCLNGTSTTTVVLGVDQERWPCGMWSPRSLPALSLSDTESHAAPERSSYV